MKETAQRQLIGIAIPTIRELRATALACLSARASGEADAVDALREAGFAGGPAIYEAFEQWLAETGSSANPSDRLAAADLTIEEFGTRAARYFRDAGWGIVEFDGGEEEGIAVLSMEHCWEVDQDGGQGQPSCHVTTGMLAAFFGELAGYPVAVMETECRSANAERCRFLLGNAEMMAFKWEELGRG